MVCTMGVHTIVPHPIFFLDSGTDLIKSVGLKPVGSVHTFVQITPKSRPSLLMRKWGIETPVKSWKVSGLNAV